VNSVLATMTVIFAVAVVSPMISDSLGRLRISPVVVEIVGGVLVGPAVLDIAHPSSAVTVVSELGLAFLMFLAGYEIEFSKVRGQPLRLATVGWLVSLVLGFGVGVAARPGHGVLSWSLIGLALTCTALAVLMPMWRDTGVLDTTFGTHGMATGTIGEFGPIVLMGLLLTDSDAGRTTVVLVLFAAVAVVAAVLASRPRSMRFLTTLRRHTHTSSQLPIRVTALVLVGLLWLASNFGVDVLLGAFAAGIVIRLGSVGLDVDAISGKLDGIGYGVLIPIFFVVSGMQLDISAAWHDPASLLRIPLFLAGFLVVRGVPVWLFYRKALETGQRLPFALFSATTLPLVVVIIELAEVAHLMEPATGAALEAAAILSVVLFPSAAYHLLDRRPGGVPGGLLPPEVEPQT
jgi:Kef-type K+ transport system membrane component KefB